MTDWEGNIIQSRNQTRIIIDKLPEVSDSMVGSSVISALETKLVDKYLDLIPPFGEQSDFDECATAQNSCENMHAALSGVSMIYDTFQLHNSLLERRDVVTFARSIG